MHVKFQKNPRSCFWEKLLPDLLTNWHTDLMKKAPSQGPFCLKELVQKLLFEILQIWVKLEAVMVPCTRFILGQILQWPLGLMVLWPSGLGNSIISRRLRVQILQQSLEFVIQKESRTQHHCKNYLILTLLGMHLSV